MKPTAFNYADYIKLLEENRKLREENEHIRQNSVSHEVYKLLMDENEMLKKQLFEKTELLDKAVEDMAFISHTGDACSICNTCINCEHPYSCENNRFYYFKWRGGESK